MPDLIASDSTFSRRQQNILRFMVDMMIPAAVELPSAADDNIFTAIVVLMTERAGAIKQGLAAIQASSQKHFGKDFSMLDDAAKTSVINTFRLSQAELVNAIQVYVASSYYQDARVLASLGLQARPPHPGGYAVAATDWSLLEPVRSKGKIYRPV
jgi:hypothetical protein